MRRVKKYSVRFNEMSDYTDSNDRQLLDLMANRLSPAYFEFENERVYLYSGINRWSPAIRNGESKSRVDNPFMSSVNARFAWLKREKKNAILKENNRIRQVQDDVQDTKDS